MMMAIIKHSLGKALKAQTASVCMDTCASACRVLGTILRMGRAGLSGSGDRRLPRSSVHERSFDLEGPQGETLGPRGDSNPSKIYCLCSRFCLNLENS